MSFNTKAVDRATWDGFPKTWFSDTRFLVAPVVDKEDFPCESSMLAVFTQMRINNYLARCFDSREVKSLLDFMELFRRENASLLVAYDFNPRDDEPLVLNFYGFAATVAGAFWLTGISESAGGLRGDFGCYIVPRHQVPGKTLLLGRMARWWWFAKMDVELLTAWCPARNRTFRRYLLRLGFKKKVELPHWTRWGLEPSSGLLFTLRKSDVRDLELGWDDGLWWTGMASSYPN